jgi:hypothetical protein
MSHVKPFIRVILLIVCFSALALLLSSCSPFPDHEVIIMENIWDKAQIHLDRNYPQKDFVIDGVYYAFKSNCYRVEVSSPGSIDSFFYLDYDLDTYELQWDGYEHQVLSGENTYNRLVQGYNAVVEDALGGVDGLLQVRGDLCKYSETENPGKFFSPHGLVMKDLILDHAYNMEDIGRRYGYIEVTVQDDILSVDRCLERFLQIHEELTQRDADYYVIALSLEHITAEEKKETFEIYGITQEDLFCKDPLARLQQMWTAQEAHRQSVKAEWDKTS